MDKWLFFQLNQWAGWGYWFDYAAWFLAQFGVVLFAGLPLIRWFVPGPRQHQERRYVLLALAGCCVALGLNDVLSFFWYRPRPYLADSHAFALFPSAPSGSFPSRDASVAFTVAAIMGWRSPLWGWLIWPVAFMATWGRVFGGAHWPSDVIAALLIALLVAWFLDLLLPDLEPALDRLIFLLTPGHAPAGKGPPPPSGESSG